MKAFHPCMWLAVWFGLSLLPNLTAAQDDRPVRISRLRGELADRFEIDPKELQLNVPPTANIVPGTIVCVDAERGVEIIDRLPAELAKVIEQPAIDAEIGDMAEVREGSSLLPRLLQSRLPFPGRAAVEIRATDIRRLSLEQQDLTRLADAVAASRLTVAAFRQNRSPMLIREVFAGKLAFRVLMEPMEGNALRPALEGFRLETDDFDRTTVTSEKPVPFAFRASAIRLDPTDLSKVTFEPAPTSQATASPWELAEPPHTAAINGKEDHDGHDITVLYATCRAVEHVIPTIAVLMGRFVFTTNGLATVALISLGLVVFAIVMGLKQRLTWIRLGAGGLIGVLLFAVIAWVDARRQQSQATKVTGVYGNKRGELRYGLCKVSIPKQRDQGEFNTPFAFYVVELPEDPEKHFVVTELQEDRDAFFKELQERVAASPERSAFVFIHGYKVNFPDAVKRTAQLAVDLEFPGAPICYSWPSQGDLIQYLQDSTNAEVAAYKLKQLLLDLNANSGAKEIHLVAHSMGNDVLTRALKELGKNALSQPDCTFREVLLTAPDIDTELFETEILPAFQTSKQRITLYASANDKALNKSFDLRGSPRAGLAGANLLVTKGIETIDVSALDTDFFGHSYYGDHPLVLGDIMGVVRLHQSPGERGLREKAKNGVPYWEFVP